MNYERSIRYAYDKITGEIIDAEDIFDDRLIGYEHRKKYNRDQIVPYCLECDNPFSVSTSKLDRLHFKHLPTDDYCVLKDENLSPKTKEEFYQIYKSKESERHKYLKNRLGELLAKVTGVKDISIDNKFIFQDKEKRKPDVYFKYFGNEIVFEIQLSSLSQRYILNRNDFYKSKGIYLIWILDNFDVTGQSQMEKDLKYLSNHQNFFKFKENDSFKLNCIYKFIYLSDENKYLDKWKEADITFDKLKFDSDNFEAFFYNYSSEKDTILELQKANEVRLNKQRLEKEIQEQKELELKQKEEKKAILNEKINDVLYEIKRLKDNHIFAYKSVTNQLRNFEEDELIQFNLRLNLNKNNKLCEWFTKATSKDLDFIKFILECTDIDFDCNMARDINGNGIIEYLYLNKELPFLYLFKFLLKRGYKFKTKDETYILEQYPNEEHKAQSLIKISYLSNQFENPNFIEYLFKFERVVCIIESAKEGKIIGYKYKPNEWVSFANNVIEYYLKYWEYIELAFKHFGLYEKLVELDVKKSFQRKLMNYYSKEINTDYSFEYLFIALYPEIHKF